MEKELEMILQGTPDMVIGCIKNLVSEPIAGSRYKINTTGDKTNPTRCDVCLENESGDVKPGTIKLLLIPKKQTLFIIQKPQHWDSPWGHFLQALFKEFQRLEFISFEKDKGPIGFKLPQ